MLRTLGIVVLAAVAAVPVSALAVTPNGQQMMRNWTNSDRCAAAAQKAFPDYTPSAIAQRDRVLKQCLAGALLAPRDPQAPQQ
jgi:hypothetical protein